MAIHYETKATNVGGRKGHVYTDDRALDIDIVPPAQADGKATNPNNYLQQVMHLASTVLST
ncbi:Organic hydroperoxide resistance protein [Staphylococcus aureus]|nr:Organic hydroperoxide resistance protein [Staphylococcus aureus]